jgi:hypothetical protein
MRALNGGQALDAEEPLDAGVGQMSGLDGQADVEDQSDDDGGAPLQAEDGPTQKTGESSEDESHGPSRDQDESTLRGRVRSCYSVTQSQCRLGVAMPDPLIAELTLIEVDALRHRARLRAGSLRYTCAALAALHLGMASWVLLAGRHRVVVVYAPALIVIALLSTLHHRRAARRDGVQVSLMPWLAVACGGLVVSAALSRLGVARPSPLRALTISLAAGGETSRCRWRQP